MALSTIPKTLLGKLLDIWRAEPLRVIAWTTSAIVAVAWQVFHVHLDVAGVQADVAILLPILIGTEVNRRVVYSPKTHRKAMRPAQITVNDYSGNVAQATTGTTNATIEFKGTGFKATALTSQFSPPKPKPDAPRDERDVSAWAESLDNPSLRSEVPVKVRKTPPNKSNRAHSKLKG